MRGAQGRGDRLAPSRSPLDGLTLLADLVSDVLTQRLAVAGVGGLSFAMTGVNTAEAPQPRRLRARSSRNLAVDPQPGPGPRAGSDGAGSDGAGSDGAGSGDAAVDGEHSETWQLVRLAQAGDGEAFGLLYDRYVDLVFRFIYFRINDRTLAEDFTSETFLRALRRIGTINYQGRDIGAWFVTIARNIVLDHLKSARNRLETTTGDTIEASDRTEHAQSTETAVLDSLQSAQLMAAVDKLGDEQRECVMLRFVHGLSVSETAKIMGKNDGAIKALQHRAVRKLADLVDGELR